MTTYTVTSGQTKTGLTLSDYDILNIKSGGIANGTINSGGTENISAGGIERGAIVSNDAYWDSYNYDWIVIDGTQNILSGGKASGTVVNSGASETISAGGIANGTVVNSGGYETISAGGIASGCIINSGGTLEMDLTSSPKVTGANGEYVINGNTVHSGANIQLTLESGVTVSGLIMDYSDSLDIHSGGKAIGTVISGGGTENILSGGIASNTVVDGYTATDYEGFSSVVSGVQAILSGGKAIGTIVNDGGSQIISAGGIANDTVVNSGGTLNFDSSAILTDLTLKSGATLDLLDQTATAASVNNINQLVITSGGGVVETIGLTGNYSGVNFATSYDSHYGTLITESNPTGNVASFLKKPSSIADTNKYIISDTTANISAKLNTLQTSINKLAIISQTDSASVLSISAAQSSADHAVLAKIIGAYNLTITGTSAADKLFDTVYSHATLTGGKGIDIFNVTGTDTIIDLGNGGADILTVAKGGIANATINTAWTATADTINNGTVNISTAGLAVNLSAVTKGTSGYKITDTGGATTLIGSALGDLIIGSTGNDTLAGGLGNDTLTGGTGNDFFVFNTLPNNKTNVDLITDFVSGKDHLQFSKAIFTGITTAAGTGLGTTLTAKEFVSSTTATSGTTATSHLIYNTATGGLYYDADGNAKGAAVEVAILGTTTHPALVAADILIIA